MNLLTLLVGNLISLSGSSNSAEWELFKLNHNKTYSNKIVESIHYENFIENKNFIDTYNADRDESSFSMGINYLADMSPAEIEKLKGARTPTHNIENTLEAEQFLQSIFDIDIQVPVEVDWRKIPGRVSEVKNQKMCGSCWAFAAAGVLEGQEMVHAFNKTGHLIGLSVQNLMDCATDFGCRGAYVENALDYVKEEGIDDENSYPYEAKNGHCRYNKSRSVMTDRGTAFLDHGDEEKLKEVVAKFGPVAVLIDASDKFSFYKSGIFYGDTCFSDVLNHAVLVVGYGTDSKQGDFWIVKNSWGKQWGEEGYVRMARNRSNNCGIASHATIPIF